MANKQEGRGEKVGGTETIKRDTSAPDLNTINLANLIDPQNRLYFVHIKFPALSLMALWRKFYKDPIVCFKDHN